MKIMTQAERLQRIETLLEENLVRRLDDMSHDIKAIRKDLDADKADLAALKNRGVGLLVGVGLIGGGFGAAVLKLWQGVTG